MSETGELQKLEAFVGKLLVEYKNLQKELADKVAELSEKAAEITEKKAVIEELNDQLAMQQLEREEISDRVSRIVTQFESWERDIVEDETAKDANACEDGADLSESKNYGQQSNLYSGQ